MFLTVLNEPNATLNITQDDIVVQRDLYAGKQSSNKNGECAYSITQKSRF